jgi:hypothetical protein
MAASWEVELIEDPALPWVVVRAEALVHADARV